MILPDSFIVQTVKCIRTCLNLGHVYKMSHLSIPPPPPKRSLIWLHFVPVLYAGKLKIMQQLKCLPVFLMTVAKEMLQDN